MITVAFNVVEVESEPKVDAALEEVVPAISTVAEVVATVVVVLETEADGVVREDIFWAKNTVVVERFAVGVVVAAVTRFAAVELLVFNPLLELVFSFDVLAEPDVGMLAAGVLFAVVELTAFPNIALRRDSPESSQDTTDARGVGEVVVTDFLRTELSMPTSALESNKENPFSGCVLLSRKSLFFHETKPADAGRAPPTQSTQNQDK
eukprot:TRINITY_DN947_c0_g1_i2.p2 TRINITY_DN947_c0_g1~~TRINITY_DN947_c0_g1_i2.p2  ORF type:complete len:207 (+),score=33.52 TRINITY_DN947_c0_g1_i2:482-1102(+)